MWWFAPYVLFFIHRTNASYVSAWLFVCWNSWRTIYLWACHLLDDHVGVVSTTVFVYLHMWVVSSSIKWLWIFNSSIDQIACAGLVPSLACYDHYYGEPCQSENILAVELMIPNWKVVYFNSSVVWCNLPYALFTYVADIHFADLHVLLWHLCITILERSLIPFI